MTNSAVKNALKTLAALICVQNGFDARALMLSRQEGSSNCYLTPYGGSGHDHGLRGGGYKMKELPENGLWLCIIRFILFVVYVPFVFPLPVNLGKCTDNGPVPHDN